MQLAVTGSGGGNNGELFDVNLDCPPPIVSYLVDFGPIHLPRRIQALIFAFILSDPNLRPALEFTKCILETVPRTYAKSLSWGLVP